MLCMDKALRSGVTHRKTQEVGTVASPKLKIVEHRPSALERLVADYLAHQRSRGLSAHTAALTANVIQHTFLPWCQKERVTTPEQLTQPVLDRWATYLLTEHRTPAGKPL